MNPFHGKEEGLKRNTLLILPLFRFCVDLGENRAVIPSHYTLRYGSSGAACCPRNWLLQGSNYLPNDVSTFLSFECLIASLQDGCDGSGQHPLDYS
jgi:hypothetical protein